ncbi:hypothetical protein NKH80_02045 [Mesorhizobium sp. M0904]|uniref:hypothetical protein n=1 Tax=unclassified Mesorhizobium TaxID=325217 RepID=UPI0033361FDC
MLILLVSTTAALGPHCYIFIARWLAPLQPFGLDAWRWAFCLGSFGAGVLGLLFLIRNHRGGYSRRAGWRRLKK